MSISVNAVMVGGNITRDPQVKFLANDTCVGNFGIAVNESWKDKSSGEKKERVTFVEIEIWGKTAELCVQYVKKGDPVLVEGKLTQDTYEDKEGKKQTKTRVKAEKVHFLSQKPKGDEETSRPAKESPVKVKNVVNTATPIAVDNDQNPPF